MATDEEKKAKTPPADQLPLGVKPPEADDEEDDEDEPTPPKPTPPAPVAVPATVISTEAADRMALAQYDEVTRAGFPTAKVIQSMTTFAQHCVNTGQMPRTIDTVAKAMMVFQAGRELGIPPIKSLQSMYFVNNKLTLYGPTIIERIRGWAKIVYGECNSETATVTIIRKDDGSELSATVTKKELQERKQWKDVMSAHPETMLIYKAIGRIVRHIVPEAVGALGVEGDTITENTEETGRRGRTTPEDVDPDSVVIHVDTDEIPSALEVQKKYSLEQIRTRLTELKVTFDPKATKGTLAAQLVEALKANEEKTA